MTHIEALRAELVAASSVTGLVGQRIYPTKAQDASPRPYVVLTVVADVPLHAHGGTVSTRLRSVLVQVDCYAETHLAAYEVFDAVEGAIGDLERPDLVAFRGVARDLYEPETKLHRVSADFTVYR